VGDAFGGTEAQYRAVAERSGAQVTVVADLGHWWMLEEPARGAAVLSRFWESLPPS
jgi:hypothetical protein